MLVGFRRMGFGGWLVGGCLELLGGGFVVWWFVVVWCGVGWLVVWVGGCVYVCGVGFGVVGVGFVVEFVWL